ncbi:MAG: histidine kinase [Pseudomonadota bacterium]
MAPPGSLAASEPLLDSTDLSQAAQRKAIASALPPPDILTDRRQLFWLLQIGGWLLYGLTKWINALALGKDADFITPVICSVIIGFTLTLGLRGALKRVWAYGIGWVLGTALALVGFTAIIFSATDTFFYAWLYEPGWNPKPQEYLGIAFIQSFLLTAWVGLYVGIRYYVQYRQESLRLLKATAMAHQAQLAMLRYQLNPHFLFNTLNAISTLVLDEQPKLASKMLDKLSAFLRYSLVNEPTDKVTLIQEIDALNLYLDIEKTRFDERLTVHMDLAPETSKALVPSLILQPLIENAIKYAVAPSESGGTLTLTSQRRGDALELILTDTGPGLDETASNGHPSSTSSGVGLANTRNRLEQIYAGDYRLDMTNRATGGLETQISLPFETVQGQSGGRL